MQTASKKVDRYYVLFLIIAFFVLIAGLGSYGLAESSEARYAEISREMFVNGDYLNPKLLGIHHFHKPPLAYYITALGYRIFGINEFGARFFLQIAIIIELWLVYNMANLLYRNKVIAFMAGLIYFSFPIVMISSRNLTTDAYFTTFLLSAIYSWQYYTVKGKVLFLYLFYLLLGLALVTKGPVALIFVLVYIFTYKFFFNSSMKITYHHVLGLISCMVIGLSWYIMVAVENPKLFDYFIETQLVSRINSNSFNRSKPFWYYLPLLIGLLLPWWTAMVPRIKIQMKALWNNGKQTRILLTTSIIILLLFSAFSTKLIMYILPIFWMPAAVIAAEMNHAKKRTRNIINHAFAFLSVLLFICLLMCWTFKMQIVHVPILSLLISLGSVAVIWFSEYSIENKKTYKPAILAGIFGMAMILTSTSVMAVNSALINSTRDMVRYIDEITPDKSKTVLVYDYLLSAIPFYSNDIHITLKSSHNTTDRELQFENGDAYKKNLWDVKDADFSSRIDTLEKAGTTYLLVRAKKDRGDEVALLKENFHILKKYPKWNLYRNND